MPEGETAAGEGTEDEYGSYNPQEMDRFRRKVRRAIELNSEEDQVNRVVGRIDNLVSANKIAPLTEQQKKTVAKTILSVRRQIPDVFRRLRASGTLDNVPREERGQIIRAEFATDPLAPHIKIAGHPYQRNHAAAPTELRRFQSRGLGLFHPMAK